MKAINHSCTFSFFLCISVALFFPSSSSLTRSHSPRVYQQGTKKSKNPTRGLSGFTGSACVLILPFNPCLQVASQPEDPRVYASSGVSLTHKRASTQDLLCKAFFKNYPASGGGETPLSSGVRKSFGQNRLAIEFVSLLCPASTTWGSTTKGVSWLRH